MARPVYVNFDNLDAPVALQDCNEVLQLLSPVAQRWPHREGKRHTTKREPFLTVSRNGDGYRLTSPFLSEPIDQPNAVNAACAMLVEFVWELLRSQPHLLCLHCAAVEFNGQLVVLPSGRRSGKSTLTMCLAETGHRVFTDDFLPLDQDEAGQVRGIACGIAPRLRLPLPAELSRSTAGWVARHSGPANRQYVYLNLPEEKLAPHGEQLPIGAIVLLDRQEGATACLEPASRADVLGGLIVQNFARAGRSDRILKTLDSLVSESEHWRLVYSRADQAVEVLEAAFSSWPERATNAPSRSETMSRPAAATIGSRATYDAGVHYVRAQGVTESGADGVRFLADPNGVALHKLNAVSSGIWSLLAEPIRESDIVAAVAAAFPDQPTGRVADDVGQLMKKLAAADLIVPVDVS